MVVKGGLFPLEGVTMNYLLLIYLAGCPYTNDLTVEAHASSLDSAHARIVSYARKGHERYCEYFAVTWIDASNGDELGWYARTEADDGTVECNASDNDDGMVCSFRGAP